MNREEHRQLWEARIADYRQSGLSLKAWCAQQGCTPDQLKYWLYKRPSKSSRPIPSPSPVPSFVPLAVLPVQTEPALSLQVYIGQARIEIPAGFDPELLRELVRALQPLSPC